MNEVKKYNFNDSGLKEQFKGMLNETNKLSQNLIILQTLESLRSLPEVFAKTIQTENHNVDEQLNQTMAYDGFARLGAAYVRTIKTASGGDEVQTLGTYQYYNYNPPTVFPEVKDSNGQSWDLGKPELLIDREKVPSASDLTVMVRLAKNKMSADFKKVFDPSLDKRRNYEAEKGLFDPSEVQASFNDYLEGVRNGETVSCLGKSAEQCAKSAMSSGFLVGEVADGTFGEAQFAQSYIILKTKKEMDKRKGKMDAARNRRKGGMGRFYNQLGAIGEGLGEAVKGVVDFASAAGQTVVNMAKSGSREFIQASIDMATYNYSGAAKNFQTSARNANSELVKGEKAMSRAGERALQGALYATSGAVDFVMFAAETVAEPFVTVLTLGMGNETMNGTFSEGNYELAKFRDTNRAQRHINELGMRTGAEMYANDAALDKVVTTTLAVTGIVGAILSFTPLAPIGVGLMAVSALGTAGWKTFRGAYEGGSAGMLAGAVSGIANSALDATTNGIVGVNLSYSYANGFGAGVNIGTPNDMQLGGSVGLNYNAKSGAWGASVGLKVGLGGTDNQGNYSNWVDAGVHMNNIGRENQSQGLSATIRGQYNEKKGLSGSLGLSYDTQSGYGATVGLTSGFGPLLSVTPSWTVSEYGGLSSDVQYGVNKNLFGNIFNKVNNPEHSAANRNLLSDIFDGFGAALSGLNGENLSNGWNGIKNALFGGDGNVATVKPGPRPGTYVDEDGTVLVRDPKTGNLVIEGSIGNLILVDSRGGLSNPDYQQAVDKIHGELYPQEEGLGESVVKGFVDQLTGVLKKLLSPVVKTGLDAMNNIQEVSGKLGDVSESFQITKPLVEDTIQLLYKQMDSERQIWRNKNDAIYDQITDLGYTEGDPEKEQMLATLNEKKARLKNDLASTLDSLDSKVGSLISLASDLNAGKTTNLTGAYSQIYDGLMRVTSPELSGKSRSVANLAHTTQNFLISYFSYKVTGMAGTVNETGSASAFNDYAKQQRNVLRNLWTRYMKESNRNNERPYVNPVF
ncbi:hypothetical protein [Leptospira weilii]|uniref:hypothetical protein n=1 Tax=Leptospira weilii TaxID=28184 RepID=UPI001158ECF3|nr:hypothetical protein [Leptospira weilii]QDK27823.1 hypothetical protein FHG68_14955 [Leptospira weilii]